jgi:hypothetical protein
MKNIRIEMPTLTDEAAASLVEFFYDLIDVFGEHYYYQISRYHRELRIELTQNIKEPWSSQEEPPF